MSRVICGSAVVANRLASDWGWQGLVAYGCQSCVVVVHPEKSVEIQTLEGHKSPVCGVRWSRENYAHDAKGSGYQLSLASADVAGVVIVWDVSSGQQRSSFSDGSKSVGDMHWVPAQDASKDFLLVLHGNNNLVLWNADTGTRLWRKTYTEGLSSFCFDPFNYSNIAFLSQTNSVMLVTNFTISRPPPTPQHGHQHFRMSTSISQTQTAANTPGSDRRGSPSTSSSAFMLGSDPKKGSLASKYLRKPLLQVLQSATGVTTTSDRPREDSAPPAGNETCIQITYHPGVPNRLLLVYPKEVLFLDVESLQTVAHVAMEKSYSTFLKVIPCYQRDAVYFVQDNGSITLRIRKLRSANSPTQENAPDSLAKAKDVAYDSTELFYEAVSNSESVRVTKNYKVCGFVVNPVLETQMALVMTNGRVLFYDLEFVNKSIGRPLSSTKWRCLSDCLVYTKEPDVNYQVTGAGRLKLVLSSISSSVEGTPTVVKASPAPVEPSKQIIAVGTMEGCVQLIDINKGEVDKDFSVHSCAITCMEWCGNQQVVSCGFTQTLSTANIVRNELFVTNVRTGMSVLLRPEVDETPIEIIRVSHYCSYLSVAFRDQPLEIWDMTSHRLLRRMSKACPMIVDMAWSSKHHQAKTVAKSSSNFDDTSNIDVLQSPEVSQTVYRENLVLLDNENHLYHIVVKGMHVRDGKEVSTQWQTSSNVTCMVWKEDYLVFGDNEGRIQVWDLTGKQSRALPSGRGYVKRLSFSHQPRNFTLVALHNDGISVWDISNFVCTQQLLASRDLPTSVQVIDVDLVGPGDTWPLLLTSDECVRVMDLSNEPQISAGPPVAEVFLNEVFCPGLLPPSSSWLLRLLFDPTVLSAYNMEKFDVGTLLSLTNISKQEQLLVHRHLSSLEPEILDEIVGTTDLARRALHVGRLFGDEWEVRFWNAVLHCLSSTRTNGRNTPQTMFSDMVDDFLVSHEEFKKRELQRCALFDVRRTTPDRMAVHVERLLSLGEKERAVQLLLETDPANPDYYSDCLRACLITALCDLAKKSSVQQDHSTLKLVATNLIAAGRLTEGVQILVMIGKSSDACKYLISYNEWRRAAWLAKAALPDVGSNSAPKPENLLDLSESELDESTGAKDTAKADTTAPDDAENFKCQTSPRDRAAYALTTAHQHSGDTFKRWADHLCNSTAGPAQKSYAIQIYLSQRRYDKVIELLMSLRQFNTAAYFLQVLERHQLSVNSYSITDGANIQMSVPHQLTEAVYAEYARELQHVGLTHAAVGYCAYAGERGISLKKEIEILLSEETSVARN